MNNTQAIQNPLGVTVFGSAVLRVEPDIASLNFVVREIVPDDDGPLKAFDPGSIVVGGAVMMAFAFG
jgi:hypothetical protein